MTYTEEERKIGDHDSDQISAADLLTWVMSLPEGWIITVHGGQSQRDPSGFFSLTAKPPT